MAWIKVYLLLEVKLMKKNWWVQILAKRAKIAPVIRFFAIFSKFISLFFRKSHRMIAWINVYLLVEFKKKLGAETWG